ncbi:hypothetical protein ACFY9Y_15075 [Streptomyces fimicarius]|uniref:hypothetical protein n=1 Tax=Streptomyces griseus TaxID=1911 RepID=UPI0036E8A542
MLSSRTPRKARSGTVQEPVVVCRTDAAAGPETISDWVRSFDRREVRTLASLLASAAVLERDADCLESELNALGELAVTGLLEAEDIAAPRRLPRASVRPADAEHLDYLTAEYF